MKKFKLRQEVEYVRGHLRYGHREITIECENEEELNKMIEDNDPKIAEIRYGDVVVDDYEVEDTGALTGKITYEKDGE